MSLSRFLSIPLLAMLLLFSVAPVARASSTKGVPACFCYLNGTGAEKVDGIADDPACQKECLKKADYEGYHYALDYSSYPQANLRCWQLQTDCEKNLDGDAKGTVDGMWGTDQPSECLPKQHYCYASSNNPTVLNVEIGGTTSVVDFAQYVSVVYKYLMGFAMTVSIVFIMIGGLRYVTAGGMTKDSDDKDTITGAKKMMVQAVEGFVLLLFTYVILYTVNPQLLRLQVPKLPMMRGVVIAGNDCATLLGGTPKDDAAEIDNYTDFTEKNADDKRLYGDSAIKSQRNSAVVKFADKTKRNSAVCGVTGEVLMGPNNSPVPPGTTCNFNYCDGAKGCASTPTGGQCVLCKEVKMDNPYGAVPSGSICSQLDPPDSLTKNGDGSYSGTYDSCGYSHQPYVFFSEAGATAATIAGVAAGAATIESGGWGAAAVLAPYVGSAFPDIVAGACTSLSISCGSLKACSDYNGLTVEGGQGTSNLSNLNFSSFFGEPSIQSVCAQDPCGVGARMHTSCSYFDGSGVDAKTATGITVGCIASDLVEASKAVEDTYQRMRDAPNGSDEAKTASDEYYAALELYSSLGGK